MGNSNTKESRQPQHPSEYGQSASGAHGGHSAATRPRGRSGRSDFGGLLGISSGQPGSSSAQPPERRETRQEREARRLERERQARLAERERSMKEEHVDGGYLVTLGTYVGPEDFNKSIVRQLMIERRLAPFWRGLQDFSSTWTEYQLTCAARGLEVPPPDQPPPEGFFSRPPTSSAESPPKHTSSNTLSVPQSDRGGGSTGPAVASLSTSPATGSVPVGPLAGTSSPAVLPSPTTPNPPRATSSPFKPRAKALAAALSVSSRNGSSTDIVPREIQLPHDPFVNGQPIEVFLYKDADECPICFLSYPPYLNHTRCCGQAICSECFVQIKRADPHYPEGHGDNQDNPNPDLHPEEQAGQLISEPACCPYCQQPEFGVTYDPPPFRRGLVHSSSTLSSGIAGMGAAMSSSSSINSNLSPTSLTAPTIAGGGTGTPGSRRRTQSLSANAPNVVTTDRVRPDWSTKLATQRAHIARRAAAATALHTAAFLMGNQESRPFRGRFSRRNTSNNDGDASPNQNHSDGGDGSSSMEPGPRSSSGRGFATVGNRRTRMEDLEELMFREALRQSLATEEERRRKEEKEERKEAKKREKEERKAAKAAAKQQRQQGGNSSVYTPGTDSGQSSATASSLSLSGLGINNRRRGNSSASLRVEASVANAKAISGGANGSGPAGNGDGNGSANVSGNTSPVSGDAPASTLTAALASTSTGTTTSAPSSGPTGSSKGKAVDRGLAPTPEAEAESEQSPSASSAPRLIPDSRPSVGPSHLRQMSSASSVSSSLPDSAAGSYQNAGLHLQDPRASGLSLGSRSAASEDGEHGEDRDPSTSTEPMFNFRSLAEVVGVQLEGKHAGRRLSVIEREEGGKPTTAEAGGGSADADAALGGSPLSKEVEDSGPHGEHVEHADVNGSSDSNDSQDTAQQTVPTLNLGDFKQPPEVMITPGTPAPTHDFE